MPFFFFLRPLCSRTRPRMDTIILLLLLYYAASIVVSSAGRGVLSGRTAAVMRAVLELGIFICYLHTITIAAYTAYVTCPWPFYNLHVHGNYGRRRRVPVTTRRHHFRTRLLLHNRGRLLIVCKARHRKRLFSFLTIITT